MTFPGQWANDGSTPPPASPLEEAFESWWYNEGSSPPIPTDDWEQHTHRMARIAWLNGAYKAVALNLSLDKIS